MDNNRGQPYRSRAGALRDLIVISLVAVVLFELGQVTNTFERIARFINRRMPIEPNEAFAGLFLIAIGFGTFALRRLREMRREMDARGALLDITRRKEVEERLLEAEERYRSLVEQLPAVTYMEAATTGNPLLYVSPQIETLMGFTAEEWMADERIWERQLHPEDRQRVMAEDARVTETGEPFSVDYRIFTKGGRLVWVHDEAVPLRDENGEPMFWQGVVLDITERKRAEEQVREAEAKYRTLVEQLPAVVYVDAVDDVSTALYVSPQYENLLGFTREERISDPELWVRQLHPEDRDRVIGESIRTNATGEPFMTEYRMIAKDGRVVWVRDEAVLVRETDGRALYWQGVLLDITERKLAEETLSRREAILEAVGFAAEGFLKTRSWEEVIPEVLRRLGEAAGISRVYVFRNHGDESGNLLMSQVHEWTAPGIWSTIGDPANANFPYRSTGFGRWEEELGAGRPIHGTRSDFPDAERLDMEEEDILSIAVVPVFVDNEWWGFVGFDDCLAERDWPQAEIDALKAAADTLGAAIGRERAQARLQETETRYRTLVEQIPAVTYIQGPMSGSALHYISPQVESMLGYTPEEWGTDGRRWQDALHPDDRDRVIAEDERTDRTGEPFSIEYRQIAKDGRVVWVRDEAVLVRAEKGEPIFWQGVRIDITAAKEAERQLLEAEGRYRTLVERIPAIVYFAVFGEGAPWLYVSPQVESLLGYTADEWRADPELWMRLIHPDDLERVLEEEERSKLTGEPLLSEYRMIARDGRVVWIRDEAEVVRSEGDGPDLLRGLMHDITERKHAEEQLHEAEARYRSLVETIPAVTYIDSVDDRSTTIYISPQVEATFGYSAEAWKADTELWFRNIHPEDAERIPAAVVRHNRDGEPFDVEYRFRHADGRWMWVKDQALVVRDDAGQPRFSQGVMFDITERKQAEEQLRETEAKYRALVEHIPAVLYVDMPDESMTPVYVSPQIESLLGVRLGEYMTETRHWSNRIHPDDRERAVEECRRGVASGQPFSAEYRMIREDGRVIWVRDEAVVLHDEEGRPTLVQGVMTDITERKLAEEALQESERREREAAERLRTLDEMKNTFLAAVSHELRSPLTSILGLALTLEQHELSTDDRTDLLGRLASNARKLDRLLKDLLDIDRLKRGIVTPQYRPTDVGALVRMTVESMEVLGERSVLVETEPLVVSVDPAKVERIVENLLANAARHTDADTEVWVRVRQEDGGVLIAVEDDGPGVPADLRHAIFEPFRQGPTASPHAPGTGIGLSLVAMFADLHGGRAWVQDREGGGASFRVFLPSQIPDRDGELPEAAEGTPASRLDTAGAG